MGDFLKTIATGLIFLGVGFSSLADTSQQIEIRVLDRSGKPLENVLVLSDFSNDKQEQTQSYEVRQENMAFSPEVLVVPIGSQVTFPNTDTIAHHVYSFSRPNQFTLPLYRGETPAPVTFEHSGVVVLGCNIHDHMVGHIIVTDNQDHTWTNEDGVAVIATAKNLDTTTVRIWHPRIRLKRENLEREVSNGTSQLTIQLEKRLLPERSSKPKRFRY